MNIWRSLLSVLQAFFGVQSSENRTRDFEQGKPILFLILALDVVVVFLLCIYLLIKYLVL